MIPVENDSIRNDSIENGAAPNDPAGNDSTVQYPDTVFHRAENRDSIVAVNNISFYTSARSKPLAS